ncbi:hypothetical protein D1007_02439 [Hordeum vulgare]|uniref:Predicted protein n=1 Tax=Hordeum vulgare subsp. vulgare TaxID=112509 RepID=F2DM34_HORVV|nr:MAPK kinase substrate protein At1g80180-like [Hordeum vulgare subsp. vulgare]KAE8819770.1 hypothetical protein D1007_02439 [Hordeum vulgare]KAI4999973.1 hypothetical protein ZWY2020_004562 [Hordeum vulgare]BAJ96155.1 predicted protein [Hordeum vulgare subsp. vulgare]
MAGLQRSSETFRRSGSSGSVWEDKQQLSASGKETAAPARMQRSGSSGGHGGYRAGHVQPALDPPSPRVAACGFCSLFGKPAPQSQHRAGGGSAKGKRR